MPTRSVGNVNEARPAPGRDLGREQLLAVLTDIRDRSQSVLPTVSRWLISQYGRRVKWAAWPAGRLLTALTYF